MPNSFYLYGRTEGASAHFGQLFMLTVYQFLSVFGQLVEGDVDQADIEPQVGVRQNSS